MTSRKDGDDFFATLNLLSQVIGIPFAPKGDKLVNVFIYTWDAVVFIYAIFWCYLEVVGCYHILSDLTLFFQHFGVMVAHILGLIKFTVIAGRNKLDDIKKRLQTTEFIYESNDTFIPEKLMEESKIFCKRFVIILFVMYCMVGGTSHYSAHKRLNEEQPYVYFQNATCYDFMPHYYMIPFETDTTSSCKVALVIMDLGMGILGLYIAAYDASLSILLICLRTNLQILCEATRTIRERTVKRLNLSKNYETFRDDEIPELENRMFVEIRKCNLHMAFLMRAHEDIEDTFCLVTLLQTASSLFMIASNLIILSTLTPDNPLFWCIVQFIISCIFQLGMYCYFGSSITEMCYTYRSVVYECDWYSSSKRFKTCVLMMMARMEKPLYLTAGKFYPLTLNTAIAVVKGAYSYSAMFRSVG